jgi:hypothetical protein
MADPAQRQMSDNNPLSSQAQAFFPDTIVEFFQ